MLLDQWLASGRDYPLFWDLTPREVVWVLKAEAARFTRDHDAHRVRLWEASRLNAIGYHNPKKLPKRFEATGEKAKPKGKAEPVNTDWARAQVHAFFAGFKVSGKGH